MISHSLDMVGIFGFFSHTGAWCYVSRLGLFDVRIYLSLTFMDNAWSRGNLNNETRENTSI